MIGISVLKDNCYQRIAGGCKAITAPMGITLRESYIEHTEIMCK